jgi:mannonate dehydratase
MFIHSWRWFGPDDRISLNQIIQTGANSIVTALHHIPVGEPWSSDEIRYRKKMIEQAGLNWGVVESVPVHEDIKKRSGHYLRYIEAYKQTLIRLGKENIKTVCYNFMPALDWSRTNLAIKNKDGSKRSGFSFIQFAVIDLFILKRPGAETSYPQEVLNEAEILYASLNSRELEELERTFLLGFPGSLEAFSLKEVLQRIEGYRDLSNSDYMSNLKLFLQEIVPVAESAGIALAIHPDDPPWPLLGLPRAVSKLQDAEEIIHAVDSPTNGITFCTGSFGAALTNDLPLMAEKLAHRINFLHIRNVNRDDKFNFLEENLFAGDIDLASIIKTMILEDQRRTKGIPGYTGIPIRPDHGAQILGDYEETYYPGYNLYGRLKNLAEIRGLEMGIRSILESTIS